MIIIGTAGVGSLLFMVGIGIMAEQYPGASTGQAAWVWWMYFTVQMVLWVAGYFFQFCWGYKKHGHSVGEVRVHGSRGGANIEVEIEIGGGGNNEVEIELQGEREKEYEADVEADVNVDVDIAVEVNI